MKGWVHNLRVGDGQLLETLAADLALVAREPGHGGDGYHQSEVVLYMQLKEVS
jgi:hypothetical protein